MNSKQSVIVQDMDQIIQNAQIPWEQLRHKTVFVTGATGLIGRTLVNALLHRNMVCMDGIAVTALVRDVKKGEKMFLSALEEHSGLKLMEGSVEQIPEIAGPIDYVIHCACPTGSRYFVDHPVDTIQTIMEGTKNILELAKQKASKGVVFLSSMEVYGAVETEQLLSEDMLGAVNTMSPRSCYPLGKRMAENLCCGYWYQYGVPVTICRLAQTFGPGVLADDGRVFAYMARCAMTGTDIELATSGGKKNMYLYTADAVTAILTLLLRGKPAMAYNAANPETYCSVKEMAQAVAGTFGQEKICVRTNVNANETVKYRPGTFLCLDTSKLQALGWKPSVGLMEMYKRMMSAF